MERTSIRKGNIHGFRMKNRIRWFIIENRSLMNNIAASLVESYMYTDMYNREYTGGDNLERIHVGGAPVNYMVSSLNIDDNDKNKKDNEITGGNKQKGRLANKVVPAGLVVIQIRKEPDVEFEEQCHPEINREVVPHELFDRLFESILQQKLSSTPTPTPTKYKAVRGKTPPKKRGSNKKRSRKST